MPKLDSPESIVEAYLHRMAEIADTGASTAETSFYSALENLSNAVGKSLSPRVICNGQLRDQGAGHPDFGLYTQQQCKRGTPKEGEAPMPERGVVEVKAPSDDTLLTADTDQVTRYWRRYGLVLVTNYRDFVLIGMDANGRPVRLESFSLADDAEAFWDMCARPRRGARQRGPEFVEYLKRALVQQAPLSRPADLAWLLASYARDALARVERRADLPAIGVIRGGLEQALGMKFEGERGEHFFRSTLVQTLFYGIFSAWVQWSKHRAHASGDWFDWRDAAWSLHVPMVRSLFEQVATPSRLGPLDLVEVLDWTGDALNRVDRKAFFAAFDQGRAVQYFYEPFLANFDPELRKQLGVWYTPPEVVRYMVARVDQALQDELGIADGLADPNVYVLDPCCGTGSFVVETLNVIAERLHRQGSDALLGQELKEAATSRVFGFEIMPAPFVIAHRQVGMRLADAEAPLASEAERACVYLTNALTGWQPADGPKQDLPFPELEEERDAAEHVKRDTPILVVIGNPPYNAFAGTSPAEEEGLVEPYKEGLIRDWGIRKFNIDELYVRFLRVAERRIVEQTGRGIVSFISSYSYLSDPSFVVLRKHLLDGFDTISIDSLNGDSRETGKLTPEGEPDPSILSTEYNRVGIRLGTAVGTFVRSGQEDDALAKVRYRDFWGKRKRDNLLASLEDNAIASRYALANPSAHNRYDLRPG
ncbi:MAG: N-6 DNA methylase [Rhodovibrio sp.]|nr:N-6 DNA methylase [Rhodovibrio sp.]